MFERFKIFLGFVNMFRVQNVSCLIKTAFFRNRMEINFVLKHCTKLEKMCTLVLIKTWAIQSHCATVKLSENFLRARSPKIDGQYSENTYLSLQVKAESTNERGFRIVLI